MQKKETSTKEKILLPKKTSDSKSLKTILKIIGGIIIAFIIFSLGLAVGLKKAKFSCNFGKNYEKNFAGPRPKSPMGQLPFLPQKMEGREFRNAHGLAGEIISVGENNLIVKDKNENENTITIHEKTLLKVGDETILISDISAGDKVVIVGKPDDSGNISANLIRVFKN